MVRHWVLAVALLGLAACTTPKADNGIASAGGATTTPPTTSMSPIDIQRKWAHCMREHGITAMPDPDPNEGKFLDLPVPKKGAPEEQLYNDAFEACKQWDPGAIRGEPSPEKLERWRKWAECLRSKGFDVSDPDPANPGPPVANRELMRSPAYQQAMEECGKATTPPGVEEPQ